MSDRDVLLDNYNSAALALKKQLRLKSGGSKAEKQFGIAYQELVKAGRVQQLRERYRP